MARLPRLAVARRLHLLVLRSIADRPFASDQEDCDAFRAGLARALAATDVALHAWALTRLEAQLLVTPAEAAGLGHCIQALGRQYVPAYHRRHAGAGALWDRRFRSTVIDGERFLIEAMAAVETLPLRRGEARAVSAVRWSSLAHHLGLGRDPLITEPGGYWQLGNTPFEREATYRQRVESGLDERWIAELEAHAARGWAFGGEAFITALGVQTDRPLQPRLRGRPRGKRVSMV